MFTLSNGRNDEYIVVQKERSFRLTKDVLGRPVIDKFGFKIGKVNDVAIANSFCKENPLDAKSTGASAGTHEVRQWNGAEQAGVIRSLPGVTGILMGKKFVPWTNIKKIGSHFTINESLRREDICPIPKDHTFLVKKVLDEQLIDKNGRYIGRVDDIRLSYNIEEHLLRVAGLYSGGLSVLMRIGVDVFGNFLPWSCVERIRNEKPTGIVLNFQRNVAPISDRYVLHEVRKV